MLIQLLYLLVASLFMVGLHYLHAPTTAPRGNRLAALGMLLAVVVTLFERSILHYEVIFAGLMVGALIGAVSARFVHMTAMPQMVGLFNGFGGAASALVSADEYGRSVGAPESFSLQTTLMILLGVFIGGVTFSGSMIAFGKLQGLVRGNPLPLFWQRPLYAISCLGFTVGSVFLLLGPEQVLIFIALLVLSLLIGLLLVLPIGAADMPVVISLLNSCSGLAASVTGFVVVNPLLIIAGALVGASGLILTQIMCKSMNRSLFHVLFEAFGTAATTTVATRQSDRFVHTIGVEESAMLLTYGHQVVIVPGYGMAVAQAQHVVHELAELLKRHGVIVKYAIHPVAGRMPGHMNVLLAEANVPYTELYDMENINREFEQTDVALIVGANDIVNPAARSDTQSPIYGMPILDVDKAHHVIVIKRSLSPGFAGIDNALFYHNKTMMLFGDARQVMADLINEVKQL